MKIAPRFSGQFVPNVGTNAVIARGADLRGVLADLKQLQAKAEVTPPAPPHQTKSKLAAPASQAKPEAADVKVHGFEMQTLANLTPVQKTVGTLALMALAAALIGAGYVGRRNKLSQLKGYL